MTAIASISRPNTKPAAYESTSNANAADARLKSLPASARQKAEHLRRTELRSRALIDGLLDESQRVRERHANAASLLGSFDRHYPPEACFTVQDDGKRVPTVFPERVALVERIEHCKAEQARLADEQQSANVGYSTSDLLDWLASQSTKFVAAPVPFIKLNKGETLAELLARNGEAQSAINTELATVQNAGRTIAECKLAMRAQVNLLAEKGRPDVAGLFNGGVIAWPTEQFSAGGHGAHQYVVTATVTDVLSLTVWAHRAAIVSQLDAEIERAGDDTTALSAEVQAARIVELQSSLLKLQREQEAINEKLEAQGQQIRRNCTDPLVLFGIEQFRQ